jgi:hypothetical protein
LSIVSWAFSGLSQNPGWPIFAVNCSRWESLPGMSKTVPQVAEADRNFVRTTAQIGVHGIPS